MRPIYETEADRKAEREAMGRVASIWGLDFVKLKMSCVIDFALLDGKRVVAVAEVKCRDYSSVDIDRWGGLIIGTGKILSAKDWVAALRIPFVLVIKLTDGLFYMSIQTSEDWPDMVIELAGRRDRGDWQDIEPCCLIPMSFFERIPDAS
jgi:hypothetical protein